mmetsp:Transcript_14762/g.22726  ORF Transcript_14762/g.22726 Transcript_14762/m.22726 type:complete len:258 (+) Transcript_14762:39-812(+)
MKTFFFTVLLLLMATAVLAQEVTATVAPCEQCTINYNSCIFRSTNPYEISECGTDQINCYAANCGKTSTGSTWGGISTEQALNQDCNLSVSRSVRNQDNELDYIEFRNHIEVWAKMRCRNDLDDPEAKPLSSIFSEDDLEDIYTKMSCAVCKRIFDTDAPSTRSYKSCGCDSDKPTVATVNSLSFYTSTPTEVTEYCKITWGVVSNYCLQIKPNYSSSGTSTVASTVKKSSSAGRMTTTTTMVVSVLMALTGVHRYL